VTAISERSDDAAARFATTRWDLVVTSAETHLPGAGQALSDLCRTYWAPLYAFVRRRGYAPADAEDLVQGFFAQFLHDRAVKKADRQRGRFRTFLLSSMENYLANEWDRQQAAKRGGDIHFVGLDEFAAAEREATGGAANVSPELVFDRRWAQAIVDAALKDLRTEAEERGKGKVFEELKAFITSDGASYENVATRLGLSLSAVKTAIHRLRANFRALVRREVARTVSSPDEVDDELRYLSSVLASANGASFSV